MRAVLALARRDVQVHLSYPVPFVFDLVWGVADVLVWYFVSEVVRAAPVDQLNGAPTYFAFALAGTIASLVIGSATSEISWRIREDQIAGTLETVLAQPLRPWQLAAGTVAFPFAYALVRGFLYLGIAAVALDLPTGRIDWVGVIVVLLLAGAAFAGIGVIAAAVTIVVKRGGALVGSLVFAMSFVSGSLFPVSVLPGWLQPIGRVMPTAPAFDGLRDALFRGGSWGREAVVLAAFAVVIAPLGLLALSLSVRLARRRGSLAQY